MADALGDDVSHPVSCKKEIQKPFNKKLKHFDEVFKLAREASIGSNRRWEALDPPKEIIKTELYMHQKLGLGWLIQRENSDELPPFWIKRGSNKQGSWENLMTNCSTNKRPDPLRGGFFADDIGLGKTLTLLSLIATDYSKQFSSVQNIEEEEEEEEEIELSLSLSVGGMKRMKPSKETTAASSKKVRTSIDNASNANDKSNNLRCPIRRRTTLIICRTPVLLKWQTQLEKHTEPDTLKMFTFHGLPCGNSIKVEDLERYDIVLTTYGNLMGAFSSAPALLNMEWFRVILDEAHVIRSVHDDIGNAFLLKAKNRWLVTGIPVSSGANNMHFSMAFLRSFEPYSNKNNWRTLVQLPIQKGKKDVLSRLQDIMTTICLRRLNSDPLVGLPPKIIETCFVELSSEDREKYDQMEMDYQSVVRNYLRLGREVAHYTSIDGIVQRLRQMCNEAASCPSEPHRSYTIDDVSKNPELLQKMVSVLQDGDSFDCPICISPLVEPTITCCAHMFCKKCILKALLKKKSCCPLCRHHLSESDLFSASSDKPCNEDENNNADILSSGINGNCSSKVSTLLNLLVSSRNENHLAKSVVFSQFGNMLSLLEKPLKAAGFESLKLNGWMSSERRDDIIKIFKNSNSSMVLLVDLKALGSGVHLTKVSNAYLLEPWINPATEEQVLNRVHGIAQKDVVKIVRLITRRSIEERILELHEKKKLGRLGNNMDRRQARNEELRLLMAL
ncbi:hypothetical protein MKW98_002936 [Papaver atlanticum]|uniref:Uncharacterized protein n=1 Tax=Papaver atlanticum TaxID=357466 RepID=A0AAD4T0J0_9MAGN|nr:hypothetical protein MKW98_002936 [Papaver atlanticum]